MATLSVSDGTLSLLSWFLLRCEDHGKSMLMFLRIPLKGCYVKMRDESLSEHFVYKVRTKSVSNSKKENKIDVLIPVHKTKIMFKKICKTSV